MIFERLRYDTLEEFEETRDGGLGKGSTFSKLVFFFSPLVGGGGVITPPPPHTHTHTTTTRRDY